MSDSSRESFYKIGFVVHFNLVEICKQQHGVFAVGEGVTGERGPVIGIKLKGK